MLGIGIWEWLVLLGLALVVVGPRKLPEVASTLGRWTRELRQVTRDLRLTLEVELDEEETRRRRAQIKERREELADGAPTAPGPAVAEDVIPPGDLPPVSPETVDEELDEESDEELDEEGDTL